MCLPQTWATCRQKKHVTSQCDRPTHLHLLFIYRAWHGQEEEEEEEWRPPGVPYQFAGRSPLVVTVQAKKEKRSVDAITPSTTASSARMSISHPEQKVCVAGTRCAEKKRASCNIARDLLAHCPRPNQRQILGFRRASAWDHIRLGSSDCVCSDFHYHLRPPTL
jgi:hypothetical protein